MPNEWEGKPYVLRDDPLAKGLIDITINLPPRHVSEIVRCGIVFKIELGPYNKVHNLLVDAVRPVVVEDLDVV